MTAIEIMLFFVGVVFMIGSFFVTEKLSPAQLDKVAELSEDEIKKIIERSIFNAGGKIEDTIDRQIEQSTDKVDRALEKETNEKIMAINEYSDTVVENMNKTQNEIMFLYSMLNDKQTEINGMVSDLQKLSADIRNLNEVIDRKAKAIKTEQEKQRSEAAIDAIVHRDRSAAEPAPVPRDVQQPGMASDTPAAAPKVKAAASKTVAAASKNVVKASDTEAGAEVVAAASKPAAASAAVSSAAGKRVSASARSIAATGNTAAAKNTAVALEKARKKPNTARDGKAAPAARTVVYMGDQPAEDNHNDQILMLAKQGLGEVEIAKKLELGVGEVRFVLGIYKGALA